MIARVACAANPEQSYALYLPAAYRPDRGWPVVYALDARGRAMIPAELFRPAAERFGYVIASSYNSASDVAFEPNLAAMKALWNDTHARLNIDDRRVYGAGYSGTVRALCVLARMAPGTFAGIVGASGGFPEGQPPTRESAFAFFGTTGTRDFNYDEMMSLDDTLGALALPHRIEVFDGTHQWPPPPLATRALGWMTIQAVRARRAESRPELLDELWREESERARRLAEGGRGGGGAERALRERGPDARMNNKDGERGAEVSAGELYAAWRAYAGLAADFAGLRPAAELAAVERQAAALRAQPAVAREIRERSARVKRDQEYVARAARLLGEALKENDPGGSGALPRMLAELHVADLKGKAKSAPEAEERFAAQRLLSSVLVQTGFYLPRMFVERKQYERAAFCLAIATEIEPQDPDLWYQLAAVQARRGNPREALKLLERAVASGWSDRAQLESDPAFEKLRGEELYRRLLSGLAARPGQPS